MSIFSTFGTKIGASVIGLVAVAGGVTALASTNPTIQASLTQVQSAITSKNLTDYKTAAIQLSNDKQAGQVTKINSTTQEQLDAMANKQASTKAVQDAITNNDYNTFKASADSRMLARTPDQASFDKLVTNTKARLDNLNKLSDAIKANDFNAYKTAVQAHETNEMTDGNNKNNKEANETPPTDTQIQTRFDKDIANYKSDGSLPNLNNGMFGRFGGGDFDGEGMGHQGGQHGGKGGYGRGMMRGNKGNKANANTSNSAQSN